VMQLQSQPVQQQQQTCGNFEQVLLPHLDAAHNLARWLMHREHDAEDVVQEAYLRAFKAFAQFQGDEARCWLLTIVRNTCYTWLARNRERAAAASFDEELHDVATYASNPEMALQECMDRGALARAIQDLSVEFREVFILRELEGLSYQQIAEVAQLPVGTVMSRLARARLQLVRALGVQTPKHA
jgi:RNA polymerase sigma factor (sigma-70 family)